MGRPYFLGDEDVPDELMPNGWDHAMKKVYKAAAGVRTAINVYIDACEHISRLECPPEVAALGSRGVETGRRREESWGDIRDDPYCMNMAFARAVKAGWKPRHLK